MIIEYELERSQSDNYYYCRTEKDLQHHTHVQSSFEFIYVFEGELSAYINAEEFRLKQGNAILILPHQIHSYVTTQKSSYFLAIFSPSFVYDFYVATKDQSATNPVFSPNKNIIPELREIDPKDIYRTKSILYKLVSIFDQGTTYSSDFNTKDETFLKKCLNYIERNFMHDVSLVGLSKELGYDYNYMSGLFNNFFNKSFLSFVNDYRINHAKHLLVTTTDSIAFIATACGYDNIRSFNRNFIKLTKTTPKNYRKGLFE